MTEFELFQRFGVALAIGALVGAERHWRDREADDGQRTAGLRTFSLVGMLGGAAGALELALQEGAGTRGLALVGLFIAFSAAFTLFQLREMQAEHNFSATSTIAGMLTFALGALALVGDMRLAGAAGVVLAGVLAARETLHGFMRAVTFAELRSAIVLCAMTFVILPLIPSDPIGPFGGISPARIWTLAIMLAAISFAGYVAVKVMGERHGELVAGLVGGLLSSTAVTLTNARRSAGQDEPDRLVAGALGAGVVSYARIVLFAGTIAPALLPRIGPALAAATLVMAGAALVLARSDSESHETGEQRNPFDLVKVIQLAVVLGAIGFLARAASQWFGETGVIVVSALAGLSDVDAAVITAAGLAGAGLSAEAAAAAVLVAAASNTLAKAAYGAAFGSARFALLFGAASLAALAAGAAAFLAVEAFWPQAAS